MRFEILHGSIAIAAALLIQSEFGLAATAPAFKPPRIIELPGDFGSCHVQVEPTRVQEGGPNVNLTIAVDGTLRKFTLPEKSPGWMKQLSDCALTKIRFSPANLDGAPAEWDAFLELRIRARGPERSAGVEIEKVGPLVTPPRMWREGVKTNHCFPGQNERSHRSSLFHVTMTINPDGSATDVKLLPGSEPWKEKTTRCILDLVSFIPGTIDGVPVKAEARLPIVRTQYGAALDAPQLRSTDEEIEAAYRACYPADQMTITSAVYRFDVSIGGRVSNPKVVESSGDARLDEAGICILQMMEYIPLKRNARRVASFVIRELLIRPPR